MGILDKVGDAINPGTVVAKGAVTETLKGVDEFFSRYPLLKAIAQNKRVRLTIDVDSEILE